ncbi:BlaR1 family beta-lactam sensor/signal transducer [Paenibacillus xerothermodurans]|uniref:BlaR1 family beta-lactam sensor/signal transducer n=1 Tax=Paenibacillus xerothermodurans TaxID=1977292 RepID=A0A2W1NUX7_PAEXE|nr:BlaR1 family beta-lactam sensor/signal transducer [Paenibacillus xerothermodurans]PZE21566.1 BlaR1 family beta-lactam sensor/signal transducer [Paenibacillus xerothermodurans]
MFFSTLVISCVVSFVSASAIMLIKAIFRRQLTAKWHYNLWFLLMLALTLPFIPKDLFDAGMFFTVFEGGLHHEAGFSATDAGSPAPGGAHWLEDFSISVNRSTPPILQTVTTAAWCVGAFIFAILLMQSWQKIKRLRSTCHRVRDRAVLELLEHCKQHLHIKRDLIVLESPLATSPMMFGLFRTYLVLPAHFTEWLSIDEIKYIFLHELNHLKKRDHITNYCIVAFQLIYWYNPLVWLAFRKMRLDREIACDTAVLQSLDDHCHVEYGNTIINFADRASRSINFSLASQLVSPKGHIKTRIEMIVSFQAESKRLRLKSVAVFMLTGVFIISQIPFVSAMARDDQRYSFHSERTIYEDLSAYFSGHEGAFVLYDTQADQYRIYNERKSTWRVSPDSTYKIYSALIGLEAGVISAERSEVEWNGVTYPYDAWNQNQNLSTALKYSVNWYFETMESRIDPSRLHGYVQQINYGNADLSGGPEPFWLESSLKISPVEQVQLLQAFYENRFGFQGKHIRTVKDAIKLEEKDGALLSGKTGTGTVNQKNANGWFIGYVETSGNTYFFATNIQSEDHANGSTAAEITLSILRDKGIYP